MDPTIGGIIAASIIAIGGIIRNIILAKSRKAERQKREQILEGIPKALKKVEEDAAKRYGYEYKAKSVKSKCTVVDLEGKVQVTREWHGVTVITPQAILNAIPEEVWVSSPGKMLGVPKLLNRISTPDFKKQITLVTEVCKAQFCKFSIEIEGGLRQADGEIDYGIGYAHSKGVCITKEEAERVYAKDMFKKEYHCLDVRFPIDKLEVEVEFPQEYNVKVYPGVFLGGSETWNDLELQRIKKGLQLTPRGACVKIEEPVLGYRYLLYWVPLSRRELKQLKTE